LNQNNRSGDSLVLDSLRGSFNPRTALGSVAQAWPALFVGMLAYIAITGATILDPTRTNWLMNGDPTQHWLGWEFFRHTPLLQWPLGASPKNGMALGSSIVFTDSIPLLALPFKLISGVLPGQFQYFGLWLAACFILQAFFAWKLLGYATDSKWLKLLGCSFFVIAPPMVWRLHQHYALVGHWVLLAALYLYFSKTFRPGRWIALLAAVVLVHAFLFVMVGAIWAADLVQRKLTGEQAVRALLIYATVAIGTVVFIMWAAGYFMLGGAPPAGYGFGIYRLNLLSLIDSGEVWAIGHWSKVLRDQPQTSGDYEGFSFLGLGVLCLGILATVELARLKRADFKWVTLLPIGIVALMLFVFALTNRIAYGAQEILVYPWPAFMEKLGWVFRATGRMFWPAYYLIYFAIFFLLFRHANRRYVVVACAVLLIAQISDSAPALNGFRERFASANWQTPLRAPQWKEFGKRYEHIVYVLPQFTPPRWIELTHFAAMNKMSVNAGYFARIDMNILERERQAVRAAIEGNRLDPKTLYIFDDEPYWHFARRQAGPDDLVEELDGVRVLAPKFRATP
jgi:Family of unknown function (DUF6311)